MSTEYCVAPNLPTFRCKYPTKFQLIINLTTAKTLGLAVPASFLSLADALVE